MPYLNWNKKSDRLDQIPPREYYSWIDQIAHIKATTRNNGPDSSPHHQLDIMCDYWWESSPWESPQQEQISCFLCSETFSIDNFYAHFVLFHPLVKVPCPFCDEVVFPFEIEQHLADERGIDIFGFSADDLEYTKPAISDFVLAERLLRHNCTDSINMWLPFKYAW